MLGGSIHVFSGKVTGEPLRLGRGLRFWLGQPSIECQLYGIFVTGKPIRLGDSLVVAARRDWMGGSFYAVLAYRSLEGNGASQGANILVPLYGAAMSIACGYVALMPGSLPSTWSTVLIEAVVITVFIASVARLRAIRAARRMVSEWVGP